MYLLLEFFSFFFVNCHSSFNKFNSFIHSIYCFAFNNYICESGMMILRLLFKYYGYTICKQCTFIHCTGRGGISVFPKCNERISAAHYYSRSGRLYIGRCNALTERWSMCDAEVDWHEHAFHENSSRSVVFASVIFLLFFL
jgi:hypothetical protein